ncbi:MAG TPA: penicillin acylase family protein [Rhodocyclaceae bacterium]|nr:penicillin acylase family protein [Rhodocyclaceae bacterium]
MLEQQDKVGTRWRTLKRVLAGVVVLVLLLALAGGGAAWWLIHSGRAVRDGELRLAGLDAPVAVRWDAWGVPHLAGESGRDLAMALGYLHANDRMTQLELGRRAAAGRLSEVFGRATLEADIEARTLRLRRTAEATWNVMEAESRQWLIAYSQGVNAWLAHRGGDLPPTLRLLGIRPEPWTAVDSLSFVFLMARELSFWQGRPEEQRFTWLARLGVERLRDLLGEPDLHVPADILAAAERGGAPPAMPTPTTSQAPAIATSGSNGWAVGAVRSTDGLPLVANDLHLPMRLPGTWYQVHLRAPDYEVMGVTLPGMPGVVVGQSRHLAWALTSAMLDDHDIYFEQADDALTRVRRGDAWQPLELERSEIGVRGADAHVLTLRASERGPLLPAEPQRGLPLRSLAWTAYLSGDPLVPFMHLARVRAVAEIPEGIASFVAPAQNLVAADHVGGLLQVLLGRVPERRGGDGRLPAPGWDPAYGWDGLREAAANPSVPAVNDALVSANDDARPADYALPLAGDFDLPARANRIRLLLERRPLWHANDMAALQTDIVSLYAREIVALAAGEYEGTARLAYDRLSGWDGRMAFEGPSVLFVLFERHLVEAVFAARIDLAEVSGPVRRTWLLRLLRGQMDEGWFDDVRTATVEGRAELIAGALAAAWQEGVERWGEEVARWPYGELSRLELRHPLGTLPVAAGFVNRGPFVVEGSATTVAAFGTPWPFDGRAVGAGPTMRWVSVVGDGDRSLAVLPGGQAGHPFDRHYDDQLEPFLQGRMRPLAWSEEAIERATVSVLRLVP